VNNRRLLIALVVSLALNLFLVGLGAGALLFGGGSRATEAQQAPGQRRGALWRAGGGLSEQYRPAYRQVLRNALQSTRGDMAEARRLKRKAFEAMASDPYDPKAVSADLEAARALEFKSRTRLEQDIAAFAATLPPRERVALSESLRAAMTRLAGNRLQNTAREDGQGEPGR
jgi:uncharacterized membrane protein